MQIMWIRVYVCIKLGELLFLPSRIEYLEKKEAEPL